MRQLYIYLQFNITVYDEEEYSPLK